MLSQNNPRIQVEVTESLFDEVHLWLISIDAMETQLENLWFILSGNEMKRTKRFHFEKDQKRFIVARGMLRTILSQYLNVEPKAHEFRYNQYGKPYLVENNFLRFNVSHSGDKVLYGITQGREIGVDVEYIKPFENAHQIVERYFSDNEKDQFHHLPDHMRNRAFFDCWTRKEAYIKAQGKGISLPLDAFSVSFLPGQPTCLLETKDVFKEKDRWTLSEVKIDKEYVAAVAVEGHNLYFKRQEWSLCYAD